MMRILLDPQIFVNQKVGGVSRQFVEVWQRLKQYPDVEICSSLVFSENYHLKSSHVKLRTPFRIFNDKQFKGMKRIRETLNHVSLLSAKKMLSSNQFQVFLPTYYDPYFVNSLQGTPLILSVFDMIHEKFPQYFPKDTTTVSNKRALLYNSARIIVHSNQTKNDILKIYPDLDITKIDLVPLASSVLPIDISINKIPQIISQSYILFVGTRDKYKNFSFFLNSIKGLLRKRKLHLICAGGGAFTYEEKFLIDKLGLSEFVTQITLSDQQLPLFYKNAKAFVFPSEYEGFGMPILEAMACGCPVILSDNGVFREVGGEAALYFTLDDELMLIDCIERILVDDSLRNHLIEEGFKREKMFSWDITAKGYYESIRKVIYT